MDLCKTRTKKSSPDMFNFHVVFTSHDTAGPPCAAATSKPHHYNQNAQEMKDLPISCV